MALLDCVKQVIPGGVNSPVRAFGSTHMDPIFFIKTKGCHLCSSDGREHIDYICSWGPVVLGHGRGDLVKKTQGYLGEILILGLPSEVEIITAEAFARATKTDTVWMANPGTETTTSAIRLARGYTGRNKIIKFEGYYHGRSDSLLVKSESGTLTYYASTSLGVPQGAIQGTIVCRHNDPVDVQKELDRSKDQIACIIIEPIAGSMGVVAPGKEFLQGSRKFCDDNKALLIFDEVVTGFRARYGSAGSYFDVRADLHTYGKTIGGGLPVGAFAGSKEVMEKLSLLGEVYQVGTLSGDPLAMKIGLNTLKVLEAYPETYEKLDRFAYGLDRGFSKNLTDLGIPGKVARFHSMPSLFFGEFDQIKSSDGIQKAGTELYAKYFQGMVKGDFIMAPAQFEATFPSDTHTEDIAEKIIQASRRILEDICK